MPNIFFASLIDLLVAGTAAAFWYLNAFAGAAKVLLFLFLALFVLNLVVSLIGQLVGDAGEQDIGAVLAPTAAASNE